MPDVLKTVGRYEVLREVGRGGMAVVYLSRQTDLDRFVALKELAAFHASDPAFAQRFLRESRVAGSLSHPNIVTVHDYFEHDGTPYIAMEYVERGSLRPWIGRLSPAQIGGVLEGLLAGLAQAEQHGVVHRDLKPENLMVTSDGRVKIADFGIAKATNQMQTGAFLTATGTTVGTPTYMAPEQAMAQDIGPWTDLYSVGCMAFEMFTGRVPFHDSEAPMAILLRHVNEPIQPITAVDPSVDPGVSEWVEKLLVKDPKERTQNANDAWDDFEELIIGLLGPRWRRSARLSEESRQADTPKPLTPAPFEGAPEAQPSDEFQSFAWGAGSAPPGPATPPPSPAPKGPLEPGPIDVPTGPPTPPPLEPVAESGFVTFGAPEAPAETPAADAPPAEAPAPTPPATGAPAATEGDGGFLTFGAPPAAEPPATPADEPAPPAADGFETFAAPGAAAAADASTTADAPDSAGGEAVAPDTAPPEKAFDTYVAPPPPRPPVETPAPASEPVAATPGAAPPRSLDEEDAGAATAMPRALDDDAGGATAMPRSVGSGVAGPPPQGPRSLDEEPSPREPRKQRNLAFPIAIGAVLVAAVVLGLLLGGGGGDDPEPAPAAASIVPEQPVSSGSIALAVPKGWQHLDTAPAIPGLSLEDGAAYAPGGRDGGRAVVFGMAGAHDSTLLEKPFREKLGLAAGKVPERTAVKLGPDDLQAYRYAGLQPEGLDRTVTVYAAPTSAGVATVACVAPSEAAEAFAPECEGIADTLQVNDAKAFPVGPDPAYAKTLNRTFNRLDERVANGRKALSRGGVTFRGQARAASGIQAAYADAAKQLEQAEISPADRLINAGLVDSLTASKEAWKKAASAASDKNKGGFQRSGAAIRRTQQQLAQTLATVEAAGYTLDR